MKKGFAGCFGKKNERGATAILFTLIVAAVLLPIVGLAIDGAVIFWSRAKLSAAVDAAALAAGRAISPSQSISQNQYVVTVAQQWFAANFPSGWLGTTVSNGGLPTVTGPTITSGQVQIGVSASATVPLYFMRLAGFNSTTVSAAAQSSRRNTYIVMVLDRSGSMHRSGACPVMQADAIDFANMFTESFDNVALVTYSTYGGPSEDYYTSSQVFKSGIKSTINSLVCNNGATNMTSGLNAAYNSIKNHGLQSGLNVIVLFTDGQANAMSATYTIRKNQTNAQNLADVRYGTGETGYGSYSVQGTFPQSACTASTIDGVLASAWNGSTPPAVQGYIVGLFQTGIQTSVTVDSPLLTSAGCYFPSDELLPRLDVAYLPTKDDFGNPTSTGYGTNAPYYGSGSTALDTFPSGDTYATKYRPDEQLNGIIAAAMNTADYQAQAIRNDRTYNTVIYTIGLGGADDMPVDDILLERIANDPRSPIYNPAQTAGYYAYASDSTKLYAAFYQVASQILRLTK